jgi:hypothetical protein
MRTKTLSNYDCRAIELLIAGQHTLSMMSADAFRYVCGEKLIAERRDFGGAGASRYQKEAPAPFRLTTLLLVLLFHVAGIAAAAAAVFG